MNYCPMYKHPDVFSGFNNLIKALGGREMTEEEFKDSALRNQRTGIDLYAMEAAYRLYDKNNGNTLNKTPDGKPSVLFETFKEIFGGDEIKAYAAKSKVYTDGFLNWFGDWINNKSEASTEASNVSKVVDENGEPLVVYHNTPFDFDGVFDMDHPSRIMPWTSEPFGHVGTKETADAIKGTQYSLFINLKNPLKTSDFVHETVSSMLSELYKQGLISGERYSSLRGISNQELRDLMLDLGYDGTIYENKAERGGVSYSFINPNQIKSATDNNGNFSKKDNNIHHLLSDRIAAEMEPIEFVGELGTDITSRLLNGEAVSSDEIINAMNIEGMVSDDVFKIASILSNHKIPVILDELADNVVGTTFTNDNNTSVIVINKNFIDKISKQHLAKDFLHEVVHAVTTIALTNPKTESGRILKSRAESIQKEINSFIKKHPGDEYLFQTRYAASDIFELSSIIVTDSNVRSQLYDIANIIDSNKTGFKNKFKSFINSISKVLINKNLFATTSDKLSQYEQTLNSFLEEQQTNDSMDNIQDIVKQYRAFSGKMLLNETILDSSNNFNNAVSLLSHNQLHIDFNLKIFNKKEVQTEYTQRIAEYLKIRTKALKGSHNLSESEKIEAINQATTHMNMFIDPGTANYIAITSYISQSALQLVEDKNKLKEIKRKLFDENESVIYAGDTDYMNQLHSNFGMHKQIVDELKKALDNGANIQQILDEYNAKVSSEDEKIAEDDIQSIIQSMNDMNTIIDEGVVLLDAIQKKSVINSLKRIGIQSNNYDLLSQVSSMEEDKIELDDVNWFDLTLGASDASSSEMIRALSYLLNKANDTAMSNTDKIVTKLLLAQKECKKAGQKLDLIYELDKNGNATGNIVRDLNFGQYHNDYDDFLNNKKTGLNATIAGFFAVSHLAKMNEADFKGIFENQKELNKKIPSPENGEWVLVGDRNSLQIYTFEADGMWHIKSNTYDFNKVKDLVKQANGSGASITIQFGNRIPPLDEAASVLWNVQRNKWISKHANRRFSDKYYEAYAEVPHFVMVAMQRINNKMQSILDKPGIKDTNGVYHFENLSDEDWSMLNQLWAERAELRSDYDKFGNKKIEGSHEYKIAKALQKLYTTLYGDEDTRTYKENEWKAQRDRIIEAAGGQEEYEKHVRGEKNNFDFDMLDKWDSRNSVIRLKTLKGHKSAIVFEKIDEAMRGYKPNYGSLYDKLEKEKRDLLKTAKDPAGEINPDLLSEFKKNRIREIQHQMSVIRKQVIANNPTTAQLASKYKELFDLYLVKEDTRYFRQIKREIERMIDEKIEEMEAEGIPYDDDEIQFDRLAYMSKYEDQYWYEDDDPYAVDEMPYSWLQKLKAVNSDWMEVVPGKGWVETTDISNNMTNAEYDESYHAAEVPKRSLYDNSKAYSKVSKEGTAINKMYNLVVQVMRDANKMQTNRQYTNEYQLPQVKGGLWRMIKASKGLKSKIGAIFKWAKEKIGFGKDNLDENNTWTTQMYSDQDQTGHNISGQLENITGSYADGHVFNSLRQYYISKLENPSEISRDLVNIVASYYMMSTKFDERQKIKDECETIVDYIKDLSVNSSSGLTKKKKGGKESESRMYKQARQLLDMGLYDYSKDEINVSLGKLGNIRFSSTLSLVQKYTTTLNLGMNPGVAAVGLLSANYIHLMNAITGQKYGKRQLFQGYITVAKEIFFGLIKGEILGNNVTKNKLQLAMQMTNVAGQIEKRWQNTRLSAPVRSFIHNWCFGFMGTADYLSKANIMVSVMKEYRLVNGEFMTRDDIEMNRFHNEEVSPGSTDKLLAQWGSSKSMWDLLKVTKDKTTGEYKLSMQSKNEQKAFDDKFSVLRNRCLKYAENADGMATVLQKAGAQRSWLGAFFFIHRQYLPLMIQERWGNTVWDNDTQQYKNGLNRVVLKYLQALCFTGILPAIVAGIAGGNIFLSSLAGAYAPYLGLAASTSAYAYAKKKKLTKGKKWSSTNKQFFNDQTTEQLSRQSQFNRYTIKRVTAEVLFYNILIAPLVAIVNQWADDDRENWWKQTFAYWASKFQWESYTPYRYDDILNSMKSATAATSVTDALEGITNFDGKQNFITPISSLLNLFSSSVDSEIIQQGAYRGFTKNEKAWIKTTPFKNIYEQGKAIGVRKKNEYIRNQMIKKDTGWFNFE